MRYLAILLAVLTLLSPLGAPVNAEPVQSYAGLARLLRYPDVSATQILVYGGDIWVVESAGGLPGVTSVGEELFPALARRSMDRLHGPVFRKRQVYVVGVDGGRRASSTFSMMSVSFLSRSVHNQVLTGRPARALSTRIGCRIPTYGAPYVVPSTAVWRRRRARGGNGMFSPDGRSTSTRLSTANSARGSDTARRNQDIWIFDLKTSP
jgi:hypothetical protein